MADSENMIGKLNGILQEKNDKLLPENLREGIRLLGIEGILPSIGSYYTKEQIDALFNELSIELENYIKDTDYATLNKSGVIKTGNGVSVSNDGKIFAEISDLEQYQEMSDNIFIGKGTLENVLIPIKENIANNQLSIDDVKQAIELLKTEQAEVTVEKENIVINDASNGYGKIEIKGNTKQKQYEGNQLIDFANPSKIGDNTTYTFLDDVLVVSSTTGTYRSISYDITDIYKSNSEKKLYFNYEDIDISNQYGIKVQINILKNNGSYQYIQMVDNSLRKFSHYIPNDTSNVANVILAVYSNNTNTSQEASISIVKPILQFGTEDKDYEPYCGGQVSPNPDYSQKIKTVTELNTIKHCGKNIFFGEDLSLWYSYDTNKFTSNARCYFLITCL